MEEDCVDPLNTSSKKDCNRTYNGGFMSASKKSLENPHMLKLSSSPLASDLRRSLKDVTYMTPNKSTRSMINNVNALQTQLLESKLLKMIENCIKMECAGCRKLIPTHLFYEHLIQSSQQCLQQSIQTNRSQIFSNLLNLRTGDNL